jgi:hypothetical protein
LLLCFHPGTGCHPSARHSSEAKDGACVQHATMPLFDQNKSISVDAR